MRFQPREFLGNIAFFCEICDLLREPRLVELDLRIAFGEKIVDAFCQALAIFLGNARAFRFDLRQLIFDSRAGSSAVF